MLSGLLAAERLSVRQLAKVTGQVLVGLLAGLWAVIGKDSVPAVDYSSG